MSEPFPDVFGDSIQVSAGPYGFTLTLYASDPTAPAEDAARIPGSIVARIRIAPELASALVDVLTSSLEQHNLSMAEGSKGQAAK